MRATMTLLLLALLNPGCSTETKGEDATAKDRSATGTEVTSTNTNTDTASETETETETDVEWAALNAKIDAIRDEAGIPALGYVLVVGGEVVLAEGSGLADIEDEIEVTGDTAFMLASVSKTFIGTSILQAMETGAMALEDPVNDHLPWALDNPKIDGESIEIRHLVTHSSGIRDAILWGWPGDDGLYVMGDSEIPLSEFMEGYFVEGGEWYHPGLNFHPLFPSGLPAAPGDRYEYSNMGSNLAGYLLETTTGIELRDHSEDYLFGPLGMDKTGWELSDFDEVSQIAMPYGMSGGELVPYGQFGFPGYPCGQLRSSPRDLGTYMAMYLQGGELNGVRVLEESSVETAFNDVITGDPEFEGQGVFWYRLNRWDEEVACHSGSDYGVSTDLCLTLDSRMGVAVLANLDTFWTYTAMYEVEDLLIEAGHALMDGA